ncbi:MAG TPA: DNA topoisomerase IV subunit A [Rhodocyclaceae bacterium]|nr:DNA topoisomerase IV subunit A [Rhodocyclaceae bacterium]
MSNEEPDLFDDAAAAAVSAQPPVAPPPPPEDDNPAFADGSALPLDSYAERAYLAYAMSVVRSRALPQVEDGLKPVQRRILYAMNEMRLSATSKHVKSARVVGDVIGKYHPHGDSSVYDAMVRVAQDFSLRYPLVDGQGNFGSRDGDGAAAMRYTECRLTPIADLLLGELNRGTVDFTPNYDGAFEEPVLLPARLPFVLLNGASGIAVGMATEIPPHNLREVAEAAKLLIRKPEATLDEVLQVLPAPDFPGGGQIITAPEDIRDAYASGRGSLRMRARWRIEDMARGQWRVIVDELPHGVSTAQVLAEIEGLTNPQPKTGKKDLSQDQKNLKQVVLGALESVRDESSEKAPVRIVLEPRSSRMSQDEFMSILLAHTSLEASVSMNLTMIGRDGRPQQKNLAQIISEWIDFRYVAVGRRTQHRLDEVQRRIHILEGRMMAFLSIDAIIKCIRESDEPKLDLIWKFKLTEIQAEDILEIRLRQLARLEGIKIEQELNNLREEEGELKKILDSRSEMTKLIVKEISEDAKTYGDDRRTLLEVVAPVVAGEIAVPDEPVTVILSKNGWVRARQGHGIDPNAISYKAGDFPMLVAESRTTWPLVIIDTNGRAYSVRVSDLPGGRGDGSPIATMIELQDGGKVAQALTDAPDAKYLFAGSGAYGFIASVEDLVSRVKAGKAFMSLEKGETPLPPAKTSGATLCALSGAGRLLLFPLADIKEMTKGRGLMLMDLDKNDELVGVTVNYGNFVTVEGAGRGGKASSVTIEGAELDAHRGKRANKGQMIAAKLKPTALR